MLVYIIHLHSKWGAERQRCRERERCIYIHWLEASLQCGRWSERAVLPRSRPVLPSGSEPRSFSRDWESKRTQTGWLRCLTCINLLYGEPGWLEPMMEDWAVDDQERQRCTYTYLKLHCGAIPGLSRETLQLVLSPVPGHSAGIGSLKGKRTGWLTRPKCINLSYGPVWTSTRCNGRYNTPSSRPWDALRHWSVQTSFPFFITAILTSNVLLNLRWWWRKRGQLIYTDATQRKTNK